MYLPPHFAETRDDHLYQLIQTYPLGTLVLNGPNGLDANHLPFLLEARDDGSHALLAHVARNNPLWRETREGESCLVVFQAPSAYVSPNWYPSKQETHRHVPTWNYQVVHVHGRITIRDDEKFVRGVVGRLTRLHEARVNGDQGWRMADAPRDYLEQMLGAIVGIEVLVDRVVGKWKLGQNREARDRDGAADALRQRGDEATSAAMRDITKPGA